MAAFASAFRAGTIGWLARLVVACIAVLSGLQVAQAQQAWIVGRWSFDNTRIGTPQSNRRFTIFFEFAPDGRFQEFVQSTLQTQMGGRYQLSADQRTLELSYDYAEPQQDCMGGFCAPNPIAFPPGTLHSHPVEPVSGNRFQLYGDAAGPMLFVRN